MRLIDADAYINYINRALLNALEGATSKGAIYCMVFVKGIEDDLKNPEITPTIEERKTGKWTIEDCHAATYKYCCSACGAHHRARYDFCPSCGARMENER